MAQVKCPKCKWEGEAPDSDANGFVECGECNFSFIPYKPGNAATSVTSRAPQPVEYVGLAICSSAIIAASIIAAVLLVMEDGEPEMIPMASGIAIMGLFTGFVGLAIRDIAINTRSTRLSTESMRSSMRR
jgi:hypothetical protein